MKKYISVFLAVLIALSAVTLAVSAVEKPVAKLPTLSKANKLTLTADGKADGFGYQVYNGSKKVSSGNIAAKNSAATVALNFKIGTIYKVRARAYNLSGGAKVYGSWTDYTYISPAPTVTYKWTAKGLRITWSEVKKASCYNLRVERINNSKMYVRYTKLTKNTYTVPFNALTAMNVNKCYKIYVAPYKDDIKTNTGTATTTDIEICGHRGAMDIAPQNTLISFQKASDLSYDSVEADYWETKSGDILILHNNTLIMCGRPDIDVRTLTTKTLKKYPITKGANVKKYPTQYIPSLEQLVQAAAMFKLKIYLHTKDNSISDAGLKKVVDTVSKYGMKSKTTIFSSNKTVCQRIVKQGGRAGFLIQPKSKAEIKSAADFARSAKAKVLICQYNEFMSAAGVSYAHNANLKLGCYDVNEQATASKFTNMGADFLITNNDFIH